MRQHLNFTSIPLLRAAGACLVALCAAACGGSEARSLVSVDVSLESGLTVDSVEIAVTQEGREVAKQAFPWTQARGGILRAGVYLPSDVTGAVMVKATGSNGGTLVAASESKEVAVRHGGVTPVVMLLLVRSGASGVDGGARSDAPPAGGGDGSSPGADGGARSDGPGGGGGGDTGASDRPPSPPDMTGGTDARPPDAQAMPDAPPMVPDAATVSWQAAENIEKDTLNPSRVPDIAVDPVRGHVIVVWKDSGAIRARRYDQNTKTWSASKPIVNEGTPWIPRVGIDGMGRAIVIYYQQYDEATLRGVWASTSADGETWSTPVRIKMAPVFDLDLAVSRNGRARAVWEESENNKTILWSSYYDGTAWTGTAMVLPADDTDDRTPEVEMDANGNGVVLWNQREMSPMGSSSVWVANFTGAALGMPRMLDNHPESIYYPSLAVNPNGQAIVAWDQTVTNNDEVYVSRYPTGAGTWSAPERVTRATGTAVPAVALDRQNVATVTWVQSTTRGWNLIASRGTPGQPWTDPVPLETNNVATGNYLEFADPELAVDASGSVLAVWRKKIDTNTYGVYASRYTGGAWSPEMRLGQKPNLRSITQRVSVSDAGFGAAAFWFGDPTNSGDVDAFNIFVAFCR